MHLRQLEHFDAVYRLRSFTRAAGEQHLTQPALSRSIRALEAELGQQLFDRSTHAVDPTAAADALIGHVVDTLASARAVRETAAALEGGLTGRIRIGTGPYPAHPLLTSVLRSLSGSHGDLQVAVVGGAPTDLLAALVARDLDLVVCDRSKPEDTPFRDEIVASPLRPEPLVLVASAANPVTADRPTPKAIAACPLALPPPAPLGRRHLPRAFEGLERSRLPFYELQTTTACLEAALDGRTITLVPLSVALAECPARELLYWIVDPPRQTNDAIHARRNRTVSPAAAIAVEAIKAQADRQADAGARHRKLKRAAGWQHPRARNR